MSSRRAAASLARTLALPGRRRQSRRPHAAHTLKYGLREGVILDRRTAATNSDSIVRLSAQGFDESGG